MLLPHLLLAMVQGAAAPQQDCPSRHADTCAAYHAHLRWAARAQLDSVWRDLRYIGTDAEAVEWYGGGSEVAREQFLRGFWERRADAGGAYAEERFAEHVRRLAFARGSFARGRLLYPLDGVGGVPFAVAAVGVPPAAEPYEYARELDIDDRGIAYVRYGAPDTRVYCGPAGLELGQSTRSGSEVWIIESDLQREDQLVLFFGPQRGNDVAPGLMVTPYPGTICDDALVKAASTQKLAHLELLERLSASSGAGRLSRRSRMQAANERVIARAAAGERALPRGALTAEYELLHFDAGREGVEVTVAVAVPARAMRRAAVTGEYAARIFMTIRTADNTVARVDTVQRFAARGALHDDALLVASARVTVPPGEYHYTLRLEAGDPAVTTDIATPDSYFLSQGPVTVPSLGTSPSALTLSSVAVGRHGSSWRRAGGELDLVPTHTFAIGERTAALYYEVHGLQDGQSYRTELVLATPRGRILRRSDQSRMNFTENAHVVAGAHRVYRELDLSELQRGQYLLSIIVTAPGRASTRRETHINLR